MNDVNRTPSQLFQEHSKVIALNKLNSLAADVKRRRQQRSREATLYLWIALVGAFLLGALSSYAYLHFSHPQFNVPYIAYVEQVSPQMVDACVSDVNCMDLLPLTDLPQKIEEDNEDDSSTILKGLLP